MPDVINGFVTAVTGVLSGLIMEVVLKALVDAGLIPSSLIFICQLAGLLPLIFFVHATRYWGTLSFWMVVWLRYNVLFGFARAFGVCVLLGHSSACVIIKD